MAEYRINRTAGKHGRAVSILGDVPVAREPSSVEVVEIISPAVSVLSTTQNDNIAHLLHTSFWTPSLSDSPKYQDTPVPIRGCNT